eukprot:1141529-Pelagomonas_calceolata.AAC.2
MADASCASACIKKAAHIQPRNALLYHNLRVNEMPCKDSLKWKPQHSSKADQQEKGVLSKSREGYKAAIA